MTTVQEFTEHLNNLANRTVPTLLYLSERHAESEPRAREALAQVEAEVAQIIAVYTAALARAEAAEDKLEQAQADEVERLRKELDEARRQLVRMRAEKWAVEKEAEQLRMGLEWIDSHDQTKRPNGGDPEWFAEQAPIRARRALYVSVSSADRASGGTSG